MTPRPLAPGDFLHCPHCHRWHPFGLNKSTVRSTDYSDSMLFWQCKGGSFYAGQIGGSSRFETRRPNRDDLIMPNKEQEFSSGRRQRKPNITFDEVYASVERPIHPNIHGALLQAMEHKNFVTLIMHGHEVSGEPHVYGMRGGQPMLLMFNAETDPQWQMVDVGDVEQVKLWLDEHFSRRELPAEFDPDREDA